MYTVKVGLTDDKMFFINQPPKLWNGNQERVRLDFEPEGTFAGAADACALSVRFSDGTEVDAPYGKCFVPQDKFYATNITFQAVAYSGQEGVNGGGSFTTALNGSAGYYLAGPFDAVGLVAGETYTVTFDGVEYECECSQYGDIGNSDLLDNYGNYFKGGVPFWYSEDESGNWIRTAYAGTYEMSIVKAGETVSNVLTVELQPDEDGLYTFMEGGAGEVLLDATVEVSDGYAEFGDLSEPYVAGETYSVTFNGVEYECVANATNTEDGNECILIGNGDIYGGAGLGNGEPFSSDYYPNNNKAFLNTEADGTYSFKVVKRATAMVKRLPETVVPSVGGSGCGIAFFDVEYDPYNNGGILSCPTFAEVDALYASAQYLIAVLKGEAHGEVNNAYMPLTSCYVGGQYVFILQGATLTFTNGEEPTLTFGTES